MVNKWKFETVSDVFFDPSTIQKERKDKIETQPSLGLLTRPYPSDDRVADDTRDWTRFYRYVKSLNEAAPEGVEYKILYLTRHGIGFHNIKHAEVGEDEWNNNWSLKDTDGVTTWFDSFLAPEGEKQARDLSTFWTDLTSNQNAPLPQTIYVSPLARCLQTCQFVYQPLFPGSFHPIVKEDLRERWTLHTCDKRRPRSWIEEKWVSQGYLIEDGFTEEDRLGSTERAETDEEHRVRKQRALEDIWDREGGRDVVALVMHSIALRAILEVVGANVFKVREGTSVGLLVKGQRIQG